jgi:hypothetical protein
MSQSTKSWSRRKGTVENGVCGKDGTINRLIIAQLTYLFSKLLYKSLGGIPIDDRNVEDAAAW